jgi:hypothetical protein
MIQSESNWELIRIKKILLPSAFKARRRGTRKGTTKYQKLNKMCAEGEAKKDKAFLFVVELLFILFLIRDLSQKNRFK